MRMVKLWQLMHLVWVSPWRAPRAQVARPISPDFTTTEVEFFARGADEQNGVVVTESEEWDTAPLRVRARG